MKTWRAQFYGVVNGALGHRSYFTLVVKAPDIEAARIAIYETHEHLSCVMIAEVDPDTLEPITNYQHV